MTVLLGDPEQSTEGARSDRDNNTKRGVSDWEKHWKKTKKKNEAGQVRGQDSKGRPLIHERRIICLSNDPSRFGGAEAKLMTQEGSALEMSAAFLPHMNSRALQLQQAS